jgi:DNA-binding YbaB/EbfC family protein
MDFNEILAQARVLQQELVEAQEAAEKLEAQGSAGGGAVTAHVNGGMQVTEIKIDPSVCDPDDVEMLEDLVLTAVNAALSEINEQVNGKVSSVGQKLNIPGF